MNRRRFVALLASTGGLAGCLSQGGPGGTVTPLDTRETKDGNTDTPMRLTGDGVEATFRVVDGHRPTDETASATFADRQVTVEGTMDPGGCREPILSSVRYDEPTGTVEFVVGAVSPFGETATVECGNASYDYRSVVTVGRGTPTSVRVVHDFRERENWSIALDRG